MERFKKETFTENYFSNFELLGKDNNDDETDVSLKHLMYFRHMVVWRKILQLDMILTMPYIFLH